MSSSVYRLNVLVPRVDAGRGAGRFQAASLHLPLLLQAALSVLPSMAFLALGRPVAGALSLFCSLGVFLSYHAVTRNRMAAVALIVAAVPAIMMLRVAFYFSSVAVILAAGVILWYVLAPRDIETMLRNWPVALLLVCSAAYWLVSFAHTGQYSSNLRALELSLAAASVVLLSRYRSWLATALVGFTVSCFAAGLALLPHSDRLGLAEIEEVSIGNPTAFGLTAALAFLLSIADGGKWLFLDRSLSLRLAATAAASFFLLLSTSRGSWLVALSGLILILLFNRGNRRFALLSMAVAGTVLFLLLLAGKGAFVKRFYDKTFSSDRSLNSRTTGRYAQWQAIPRVIADAPVWGQGAGDGPAIYRRYSGRYLAWHSLYLHVGAEVGLLGLSLLAALAGGLVVRGIRHRRRTTEIVPLIGAVGFLGIGLSISGLDAGSGIFLGLGASAGEVARMFRLRKPPEETL